MTPIDRRTLLHGLVAAGLATALPAFGQSPEPLATPAGGPSPALPAVGLGSWITFNVGNDPVLLDECAAVMEAFFAAGGRMIDSSPMYGSSQGTIGYGLKTLGRTDVFSADKVWTPLGTEGREQIETSRALWTVPAFSLLQVHNLVAVEEHLPMLFEMKAAGTVGHVGITTSHGRRHEDVAKLMETQPLDFVQFTYNPVDRSAEERLLPLARERGITAIVNRPFRQGQLTRQLEGEPLPGFASELGASTWAQLILKFILSSHAATLPIPATTVPAHAAENVAAAAGPMPDRAMREAIAAAIGDI
ncbi:aldo/keto reductase [Fulvimarina sp. 2208YS6-2-32]|uniref:Aldo/keto reductase n=1 Tax=Fulvimarina uroteuthidis TaxID=3098149 RepID=A0ABU5I1N7_9HYPH|nr:aldo/keto reductase [Fulvimarina sp. 2208YS6-2-32]MDY8109235.1 aldo/keto reductase [Fulvimarina sp. 2208YS6-2-32]